MGTKLLIQNRQARFQYEILETYEAGLVLQGTEVKSLREGEASIQEAYVKIKGGEAFLIAAHIQPYKFGNIHNHEEKRDRKLLLHKREIEELKKSLEQKGLTLVPLSLYLKGGKVKVQLGVGRGKKSHDKRQAIREKDEKKEMQRAIKNKLGS